MTRSRRLVALGLPLAICAVLQAGCVPRQIREAQDTFNRGAQSENALRSALVKGGSPTLDASSAASSYRITLDLLNTELKAHQQDLAQEQLLGTAMMLKALCLWRLADLEDGPAASAADAELSTTLAGLETLAHDQPTALGTRDRVMTKALPGLRDHDRGLRATTLDAAAANFQSACTVLGQALKQENPPPNHPVRLYVRLAQLSSLRAYQSAVFRLDPQDSEPRRAMLREIRTCAELVVLELKPMLRDEPDIKAYVDLMNKGMSINFVDAIVETPGRTCPYIS